MSKPNKTQPTGQEVKDFLAGLTDKTQQEDSYKLCQLMSEVSSQSPKMWGKSIIGFGQYHYKYESGREGDGPALGFSPRKLALTIYLLNGTSNYPKLLAKLGPHRTGKVCLYIKRLSEVDQTVLRQLLEESYKYVLDHQFTMGRAT